ncbi:uncharacterized protein LOC143022009 [Oratosquilla oratoria]|uniref:uncharacterized protein LOC143022009 n=1 Tax=Oratosquilla oratoria TaxID=337810 RepID=UPI003F75F4E9
MASLDVEFLFSHVPILPRIEIILNNVYRHPKLPPPTITENIIKNLLFACTTEAPFRSLTGQVYLQVEGVAMGSSLGCGFVDFFMCKLENTVLRDPDVKPFINCSYVEDIFIAIRSEPHLRDLKKAMETASVIHSSNELNIHNKIPFLDVLIHFQDNTYKTIVFRKKTDTRRCMNAASRCPQRYKLSAIQEYPRRAHRNCSSWEFFHIEVSRVKQILINNSFSYFIVDKETRVFITCTITQHEQNNTSSAHNLL